MVRVNRKMNSTCHNVLSCLSYVNQEFSYWNVIVASIFAFVITIAVTVCVTYLGPNIGGVLGSIPTSIVPSMLGLGVGYINADANIFYKNIIDSTHIVPIGLFASSIMFITMNHIPTYLRKIKHKEIPDKYSKYVLMSLTTFIGIIVWLSITASISGIIYGLELVTVDIISLGICFEVLTLLLGLWVGYKPVLYPTDIKKKNAWYLILLRGIIAMCIVAVCVTIGKQKVPVLAGIFSSFPAIKLSIIVGLWVQDENLMRNTLIPMTLGNPAAGLFTIAYGWLSLYLNIFVAITVAYLCSLVLITVPTYIYGLKMRTSDPNV